MPIRVTMEIIPRGDESRKFVAGVLDIENDGTGDSSTGNYGLRISGPVQDGDSAAMNDFWERARLEGFARKRGWWSCVKEALNHLRTDYDETPNEPKLSHGAAWRGSCGVRRRRDMRARKEWRTEETDTSVKSQLP